MSLVIRKYGRTYCDLACCLKKGLSSDTAATAEIISKDPTTFLEIKVDNKGQNYAVDMDQCLQEHGWVFVDERPYV